MFFGRNKELKVLNQFYDNDHFNFIVIYGRRRIGKSTLIKEFVANKPNIFFTAIKNNVTLNLVNLSKAIFNFKDRENQNVIYSSFQAALEEVFKLSLTEKFVFVIDEYPYLAKQVPELNSILQLFIDKYQDKSKMFLILCGSSLSYIEEEVLAYKAPLFGRKTGQLKLKPLTFKEVISIYPGISNINKALIYGIYGGTPYYLNQYNPNLSFEENVISTFLKSNELLFDEPENLIRQEVNDSTSYNTVLTSVAFGNTKLSEVANKSGFKQNQTAYILKNLIEMDLIEKEYPYNDKKSKHALYKIKDNMFKFWFSYIPKYSDLIYQDCGDLAYNYINSNLNDYMGSIFELICQEYLWEILKKRKSPILYRSVGRWWGANPKTKKQEEIDIIAEQDSDHALFCECKWTNKKVDVNVLNNLIRRSQIFDYPVKFYFIFSKSGFTEECIEKSKKLPNINLITFDEIIEEFEN